MGRPGGPALRAYLIKYVEGDRIKHVLHDDSENRVGSALGLAGTGYLILSGNCNLVIRILQQRTRTKTKLSALSESIAIGAFTCRPKGTLKIQVGQVPQDINSISISLM